MISNRLESNTSVASVDVARAADATFGDLPPVEALSLAEGLITVLPRSISLMTSSISLKFNRLFNELERYTRAGLTEVCLEMTTSCSGTWNCTDSDRNANSVSLPNSLRTLQSSACNAKTAPRAMSVSSHDELKMLNVFALISMSTCPMSCVRLFESG